MSSHVRTGARSSVQCELHKLSLSVFYLFARAIKLSTITLCRSSAYGFTRFGEQLALLGKDCATLHTRFGFEVQLTSHGCGSSLIGQCEHLYLPFCTAVIDIKHIPRTHMARGFAAIAIDFHSSALDRFCCQRARLEEARCP